MNQVKILIIDDESGFHSLCKRFLGEKSYKVISVESGEEAIERLQYESFNLIILDLVLANGKMTGMETLQEIRKFNSDIFILITSAHATMPQAVKAIVEKGAQTYLRKPFTMDELILTVDNGLNWREQPSIIRSQNLKSFIELHEKSIMKRCFLTGSLYCSLNIREEPKSVFVGMPFKDSKNYPFKVVYEQGIKPAIEELGLIANRADSQMRDIVIMCKVCQAIQQSSHAIIDITGWNANVLFEFGLLLGLARNVLLIKNESTRVPTDLLGFEYIVYSNDYQKLKRELVKHLDKMLQDKNPSKNRRHP